jgi:hypothetical protein
MIYILIRRRKVYVSLWVKMLSTWDDVILSNL